MRLGVVPQLSLGVPAGAWRIPLPPRMAPSFRLPTASPGPASSSRRCAGCCPPPSSGLGGTHCSALPCRGQPVRFCAPAAGKNWRGSAGVFHTGRSAVCYAAYLVGARVPPYRAGQPMAVFAGAVCLSGIPSKPAQRHGQIPLGHAGAGLFGGGHPPVLSAAGHDVRPAGRRGTGPPEKKPGARAALQFAASLAAAVVGGVLCGAIGSGHPGHPAPAMAIIP